MRALILSAWPLDSVTSSAVSEMAIGVSELVQSAVVVVVGWVLRDLAAFHLARMMGFLGAASASMASFAKRSRQPPPAALSRLRIGQPQESGVVLPIEEAGRLACPVGGLGNNNCWRAVSHSLPMK